MSENDYKICSKTVLDTSYPLITFNDNGISNHYYDFIEKVKPNWPYFQGKGEKLYEIIERIKNDTRDDEYNCILGLSGGLDSSFMLHTIVKEYGLRPLVFHVDAGWNSEIAVNNINNLIDSLDLDLFTEVINWKEICDFQLAMFKSGVPHIDIPQDMAFISVLYKYCNKYNIKYIFNGGNISTESVLTPFKYFYWGTDLYHVRDILKKFGSIPMPTYPFISVFYHKLYLKFLRRLKVIKPLNYIDYNIKNATKLLENTYNWKSYGQKHFESRFTKFYEGFWLVKRFGFDIRRVQLSSLILSNQLTRNQALKILETKPYNVLDAKEDFLYVANKLSIDEKTLTYFLDLPKKYYSDYKNHKKLFDIGSTILNSITPSIRGGSF